MKYFGMIIQCYFALRKGVMDMNIEPMISEKTRMAGMTDEDRRLRQQWVEVRTGFLLRGSYTRTVCSESNDTRRQNTKASTVIFVEYYFDSAMSP